MPPMWPRTSSPRTASSDLFLVKRKATRSALQAGWRPRSDEPPLVQRWVVKVNVVVSRTVTVSSDATRAFRSMARLFATGRSEGVSLHASGMDASMSFSLRSHWYSASSAPSTTVGSMVGSSGLLVAVASVPDPQAANSTLTAITPRSDRLLKLATMSSKRAIL